MAAGDFTASELATSIVKADAMWADDMVKADYTAQVGVYTAIKAEQNATVTLLEDEEKDREVKVVWVKACDDTVEDNDDDCVIGGNEAESDSQTYGLTIKRKHGFTLKDKMFRTQLFSREEVLAKQLLRADKLLAEDICQTIVTKLETFKGTNKVTNGIGTVNGISGNTDIAAADWNERMFSYLYRVAIQNQFSNPFLLSGENLFEERFLALQEALNANGKSGKALFESMRTYYDLFNIDPVNAPDYKTYLLNRGSVAFVSKTYYPSVPRVYNGAGITEWSIASRNLPGVKYDVRYTTRCENDEMYHDFTVSTKHDVFINPTGCDDERTGVIAFNKTA